MQQNDNFNMNIEYASSQELESRSGRRRLFTRTQTSAFRHAHRQYQLANNVYSKQSTIQTVGSNGSQQEHKSRSRIKSASSKSLFDGIKQKNYSQARLKLHKRDNFIIPTSNYESKTIQYGDVKPNLQKVFEEKLNRKTQLKIKDEIENAAMRRIVEQANKKLMRNRIETTYNLKLQQRKQNLQKNLDIKKFNSMVSDYVQTDLQNESKKTKQPIKRMMKTQVYNIQVPSSLQNKDKFEVTKNKQVKSTLDINNEKQSAEITKRSKPMLTKTPKNYIDQDKHKESSNQIENYFEKKQPKQIPEPKILKRPSNVEKSLEVEQIGERNKKSITPNTNGQELKKPAALKKEKSNNNKYDELDQIEQLESVVLTAQSKLPQKKNSPTMRAKQTRKQEKTQKQAKDAKQRQKEHRESVTQQLELANKKIDLITPMGEVAGYCSQLLKKSQLNWQSPAVLLYKDCYQKFKSYEEIYNRASSLGIIDKVESQRFSEDNKMIQKNLEKVLKMGKKKQRISEQYEKLILSEKEVNLDSIIQKQVIEFGSSVLCSEEKTNKDVLMCLLRMINGVLIMAKIRGFDVETLDGIDELEKKDNLHQIVVKQLLKIQHKKLKL